MKIYQGIRVSSGVVVGQVSRMQRGLDLASRSQENPEKEYRNLLEALQTAKKELDSMAGRTSENEQAIFTFQSMMLDDEGFLNEIRANVCGGMGAADAVGRVGQRYADKLMAMEDNPYMQLRGVDVLDACQRVIRILYERPRKRRVLDHPVIIAADVMMPSDLFDVPSGMIMGIITSEGSLQSHAAIIARAMGIPSVIQVGRDFLEDCDGRLVALDADNGLCIVDPDFETREQFASRILASQIADEDLYRLRALPNRTRDGVAFELLANCFGPEDIRQAVQNGAGGVGLLRSGYLLLRDPLIGEDEQYEFYRSCVQASYGRPITVRTFDFGADRTLNSSIFGETATALGLRGIRSSLRQPRQFETQIRALLRAGCEGPIRVMFPMVTDLRDWKQAMQMVERCRQSLREQGIPFDEYMQFGVMLSIPAACLTAEEFAEAGCAFFCIGTNDLTQYTHAADRNLTSIENYYRPASTAMRRLIRMVVDVAEARQIPVTIMGMAPGNSDNAVRYLHTGLRSFSMPPQNILDVKKVLMMERISEPKF